MKKSADFEKVREDTFLPVSRRDPLPCRSIFNPDADDDELMVEAHADPAGESRVKAFTSF